MRIGTLADLATQHGIRLPDALAASWPPRLHATDERGWFRFQRLYELARACVRGEADMRRIVREAAEDEAREGSRWLEIQIEPSSYGHFVGGITPALEIVLDEAHAARRTTGVGVGVIVAASRIRHPLDARTLARLAARYAGDGPGTVVGFGLSNDERRGQTADFAPAFAIARRAGLALVPHGGELLGPAAVQETLSVLRPDRIGHGVRSVEDPRVLEEVADAGVTLEVCPGSNLALGVYAEAGEVPLHEVVAHGIPVALGADDPLLFGTRLVDQYAFVRGALGFDDRGLAQLARDAFAASRAPEQVRADALRDIERWLVSRPSDGAPRATARSAAGQTPP